ncbi:MAG: sugar ABC transporter permease [Clostridiales bacterium]|jgi:multiple sugar transport system permease protein|nr:sugar ABC transporter permease [Clostridiales bacterium]
MKRASKKLDYGKYGYFFILPFFVVFLVFQIYPMFYTINLSFTDLAGLADKYSYVGLSNYKLLWNNVMFRKSIGNTFIIWIVNFVPQILAALFFGAAFTAVSGKLKGIGFFKVVFYMPNIITAASVAVMFSSLFIYPYGPIDQILRKAGILPYSFQFMRSETWSRLIISFIQFWMWFGPTTILFITGILSINTSLYEAARVDGATPTQMFFRITLPLLKPIMIYILVTSVVGGLQMFDIPFLYAGGGPNYSTQTLAVFIYNQAFTGQNNYNIAAAGSVYLLIMAIILSLFIYRVLNRKDRDEEQETARTSRRLGKRRSAK